MCPSRHKFLVDNVFIQEKTILLSVGSSHNSHPLLITISTVGPITKFHNSFHPFRPLKKGHFSIYRFTREYSAEGSNRKGKR